MSIMISDEIKNVTMKSYDRCCKIEITSTKNVDGSVTENIKQYYESVVEIDGIVISKAPKTSLEYACSALLGVKWTAPWGKEVTGLDVMCFIKYWNDHYEEGLAQLTPPV